MEWLVPEEKKVHMFLMFGEIIAKHKCSLLVLRIVIIDMKSQGILVKKTLEK